MTLTPTENAVLRDIWQKRRRSASRRGILPNWNKEIIDDALFCLVNQTPYLEQDRSVYRLTKQGIDITNSG